LEGQDTKKSRVPVVWHFRIRKRSATADVANPRPREVGGAWRIQVLAAVRTQETAGGPNGATRSEFRRCCLAVDVTLVWRAHRSRQWCQAWRIEARNDAPYAWRHGACVKARRQNRHFCLRHWIHVCKYGLSAHVMQFLDSHGGKSGLFAPRNKNHVINKSN